MIYQLNHFIIAADNATRAYVLVLLEILKRPKLDRMSALDLGYKSYFSPS